MTLEAAINGLVGVLDNVAGVTVSGRPPTVVQIPQGFVSDMLVRHNASFEGGYDLTVEVTYLLGLQDADVTWAQASALMGSGTTNSIYGVLAANPTLGGTVDSVRLDTDAGFKMDAEYASVPYFGFRAVVSIYAT